MASPVPCNICDNIAAKFNCNTCGKALCATCKIAHRQSVGGVYHAIVPYARKLNPKYLARLVCPQHNTTQKYWCDICRTPMCFSCYTQMHSYGLHSCSDIIEMLSQKRDAMLDEMKTLRDMTIHQWEESLEQVKKNTADYDHNIDKTDKELAARAKIMHQQVDAILSQSRQSLSEIRTSGLVKLQAREKYLVKGIQQRKEDVQTYEDQLRDCDPKALFRFKPNEEKIKPPSIEITPVPVIIGDRSDINSLHEVYGKLSIQDPTQNSFRCQSFLCCTDTRFYGCRCPNITAMSQYYTEMPNSESIGRIQIYR